MISEQICQCKTYRTRQKENVDRCLHFIPSSLTVHIKQQVGLSATKQHLRNFAVMFDESIASVSSWYIELDSVVGLAVFR